LKLAQLDYIKQQTGKTAIVLVDDLPAELDSNHRSLLLKLLHGLGTQVFVTSTDRSHIDISAWNDVRVFHVEHGNIKEVV
jgi:DNA replication and repair protein RecF